MLKKARNIISVPAAYMEEKNVLNGEKMNEEQQQNETFESAYKRLEGLVNKMETESLDLESALKAFEEGQKAVAQCRMMLEEAELKLKDLRDAEKTEND